jgi:leucyl aminopeptidase
MMNITINQSIAAGDWILAPFSSDLDLNPFSFSALDALIHKHRLTSKMDKLSEAYVLSEESNAYLLTKLPNELTAGKCYRHFRKLFIQQASLIDKTIHVYFSLGDNEDFDYLEGLINGFAWSGYTIKEPEAKKDLNLNIIVYEGFAENCGKIIKRAQAISAAQRKVCNLVNLPSNLKYPQAFIALVQEMLGESGFHYNVRSGDQLLAENLHAIHAVGKASDFEPAMLEVIYEPEIYHTTIGLVGKGVTFDTGGISIKQSSNMHYMKCDMAGAAMMSGVMHAAKALNLPYKIVMVLPLAENVINGNALKPGDVVSSYSGKSIEIIDTDAEGRLILADALSYISKNYELDYLIDSATLTGSSVATLGYVSAALFSEHEGTAAILQEIGESWNEKVWPLPLWKEYEEDLHSDVADIRNFSGKPIAGAITAALFLKSFVEGKVPWTHLDIAGVAFSDSELGKMRNASGYGIRLLIEWMMRLP